MEAFRALTAIAVPLLRANVDTDSIIPSREIRTVGKQGLAVGLFAGWRYRTIGGREPDPAFVLNEPRFADAAILVSGENFGCGSSREHAVWALREYGIRVVIAPSFAPIFSANCIRNGVVPVVLPAERVAVLAAALAADPAAQPVTVDLECGLVSAPQFEARFALDDEAREMLLHGRDAIELTLARREPIEAWLQRDRTARPWIYAQPPERA